MCWKCLSADTEKVTISSGKFELIYRFLKGEKSAPWRLCRSENYTDSTNIEIVNLCMRVLQKEPRAEVKLKINGDKHPWFSNSSLHFHGFPSSTRLKLPDGVGDRFMFYNIAQSLNEPHHWSVPQPSTSPRLHCQSIPNTEELPY